MSVKRVYLVCLFMSFGVWSQACTRTNRVAKTVQVNQPVHYTYRETYKDKCWFGRECTKSRIGNYNGYRTVPKLVMEKVTMCCEGYMREDTADDTINCKPICMPACQNANCTKPGVCECNPGYEFDPYAPHSCTPICGDCGQGTCVAPNQCDCDFGYVLQKNTCVPVCNEPCHNGTCTGPDTCECLPGYRQSDSNGCTPYCSSGCWHGTCVAPETCNCEKGWYQDSANRCVPICERECGNGTCIAPNTCECVTGYNVNASNVPICVPSCKIECGNGTCVAPSVCECFEGYEIDRNKVPVCVPKCDIPCGTGTCVAPNTCECKRGYKMEGRKSPACVPQFDTECGNGTCAAPNTCECEPGFKIQDDKIPKCVPKCDFKCGNGTCSAPNKCECARGYKLDKNKVPACVPDCVNCEGVCTEPNKCECQENFEAKLVTVDGLECVDNVTQECVRTMCVDMKLKTVEISIPYGHDDFVTNETAQPVNTFSTEVDDSDYFPSLSNYSDTRYNHTVDIDVITGNEHWTQSKWGFVAVSVAVIIFTLIVLGLIAFYWESLCKCHNGGSYATDENKVKDESKPEETGQMIMSSLLRSRESDHRNNI